MLALHWSRKAGKCPSLWPWWGRGWADRVLGQFSNLVEVLFFQPSRPSRGRTDYKGFLKVYFATTVRDLKNVTTNYVL